jgi:hypothetical protein
MLLGATSCSKLSVRFPVQQRTKIIGKARKLSEQHDMQQMLLISDKEVDRLR